MRSTAVEASVFSHPKPLLHALNERPRSPRRDLTHFVQASELRILHRRCVDVDLLLLSLFVPSASLIFDLD